MKNRNVWSVTGIVLVYISAFLLELSVLAINAFTGIIDMKYLFVAEAGIFLILFLFGIVKIINQHKDAEKSIQQVLERLNGEERLALSGLKLPVIAANKSGNTVWYNDAFKEKVLADEIVIGENIESLFGKEICKLLDSEGIADSKFKKRSYTIYKYPGVGNAGIDLYYFTDITAFKNLTAEYKRSRPVVALITIDNLSEVLNKAKESEKAVISGKIENMLEKWAGMSTGILSRCDSKKFIMLMEERHLRKYIDDGFDILNKVRAIKVNGKSGVTLSMGIGRGGETIFKSEEMAKEALDMALGRGGDHVAIKTGDTFEFFGGISSGVEKRSKVKTRLIAATLKNLINESDRVFVMGHKFGDFDSLGSSIGIRKIAQALGKEAFIVLDKSKILAGPLLSELEKNDSTAVISNTEALKLFTQKTLLIIVDTHRPEFLEFGELYNVAQTVVVIDHHRKTVEYIENASVFFHEPTASSASEMVAEMAEYMGDNIISDFEASALLSGIMLDTKNFVIRTGVRTFDAAGYLRSMGANPIEVRQLFSEPLNVYKLKSETVSSSEKYGNCAVSIMNEESESSRIAASQAADEMLLIEGVKASFVLFKTDDIINVSARSLGDVNVQLIMELLGGGGHQTMAAAQVKASDFEDVKRMLRESINAYNLKHKIRKD